MMAALAAVVAGLLFVPVVVAAQEPPEQAATASVEVTVWRRVANPSLLYVSTRPEGGTWRTLNTPLDMSRRSSSGRFHQSNAVTVEVPLSGGTTANVEVTVWRRVANPSLLYVSTRPEGGTWRTLNTSLDMSRLSASGRFHQSNAVTVEVPLPATLTTASDRAALVALYNATDGPNWTYNTNWLSDRPIGEWYGVGTDNDGRVVRLGLGARWGDRGEPLGGNNLSGTIPGEIGNLTRLGSLWLEDNDLSGAIPAAIGNLTNLRILSMWNNSLSGPIPAEIGNLTNLRELSLGGNALTGPIPAEIGNLTELVGLGLSGNDLEAGPIPAEFSKLAHLERLHLDNGQCASEELEPWLRAQRLDVAPCPPTPTPTPTLTSIVSTFTDSTGRTIKFRVGYRAHWDLSEPRGALVSFHGNNPGTEDDMLSSSYLLADTLENGLLFVSVASPSSREHSRDAPRQGPLFGHRLHGSGVRNWLPEDVRLIHELLQNDLGGEAAIDHDRIVFEGGSMGTVFLVRFLERYFGVYGGGFYAWCGNLNWHAPPPRATIPWSPTIPWSEHTTQLVAQRMRVFVESTTEDFLYDGAVTMRDYYRDVLGLDTRWDLDEPGGHCSRGATPISTIVQWLSEMPRTQASAGTVDDHDGDGLVNALDPDDDNDGALDVIDAAPLEPRDWLDTDVDGIGDFADQDADGDGIENRLDAFSLDPTEWQDNDGDGIGDNSDLDDDNDGVPDSADAAPLSGPRNDQLAFKPVQWIGWAFVGDSSAGRRARVHPRQPASVTYPEAFGSRQSWHSIRLGSGANRVFEIMIDSYERRESCKDVLLPAFCDPREGGRYYYEEWSHKIYIDKNRNRDLTDDGPPLVMARNADSVDTPSEVHPAVVTVLKVPYSTGEQLPYRLFLYPAGLPGSIRLHYVGASRWMGLVSVPGGEPVLVGTVDANLDGVFNTGSIRHVGSRPFAFFGDVQDFACVDTNRDGWLNECDPDRATEATDTFEPIYANRPFTLDGRTYTLEISPTGHTVQIR